MRISDWSSYVCSSDLLWDLLRCRRLDARHLADRRIPFLDAFGAAAFGPALEDDLLQHLPADGIVRRRRLDLLHGRRLALGAVAADAGVADDAHAVLGDVVLPGGVLEHLHLLDDERLGVVAHPVPGVEVEIG